VPGLLQSALTPINILSRTGGNLPQNVNFAIKATVLRVPGGELKN